MRYPWSVSASWKYGTDTGWPFAGMVMRDRLKCCQRVSGAFGIMVGSGAPGTRFSQTLLKTQERVKTHTGAILVCLLLLCFASLARSRSFP